VAEFFTEVAEPIRYAGPDSDDRWHWGQPRHAVGPRLRPRGDGGRRGRDLRIGGRQPDDRLGWDTDQFPNSVD